MIALGHFFHHRMLKTLRDILSGHHRICDAPGGLKHHSLASPRANSVACGLG